MRYYALESRPWVEDETGGYWGLPEGALGAVELAPGGSRAPLVFAVFESAPKGTAPVHFGDGADQADDLALSGRQRDAWRDLLGARVPAGATLLDALWSTLTEQADPDGDKGARPIMPTHRGELELYLGGTVRTRAERLPADPRRHRAWPRLQAALQRDYAGIERRDPAMARKWLGAQARKYRLPAEAARDLLIPAGLPRVMPAVPTTTFADDFGRPDGPVGADWVAKAGTWSLVGGQLVSAGGGANYERVLHWAADLSVDDHDVQADLISYAADTAFAGPAARVDPASATYYAAQVRGGTTRYSCIYRVENGVRAILAKGTGYGVPATSRLVCDGSTIQSYNDGVLAFSVTDTAITGHLRAGIAAHPAGSVAQVFDNFCAADLLPEVTGTVSADESGIDTAAAMGGGDVRGSASALEPGPDSAALDGGVATSGDATLAESGDDAAGVTAGVSIFGGAAGAEIGLDSAALDGGVATAGDVALAEAGDDAAGAAAGVSIFGGAAGAEIGLDSAALDGGVATAGAAALAEAGDDAAGAAAGVSIFGGAAGAEIGRDVAHISGAAPVEVTGDVAGVESGPDTAVLDGGVAIPGDAPVAEMGEDAVGAIAGVLITVDLSKVEPVTDIVAASGTADSYGDLTAVGAVADAARFTLTIGSGGAAAMFAARGLWRRRTARAAWPAHAARGSWRTRHADGLWRSAG